jgi:hypothetical protein
MYKPLRSETQQSSSTVSDVPQTAGPAPALDRRDMIGKEEKPRCQSELRVRSLTRISVEMKALSFGRTA